MPGGRQAPGFCSFAGIVFDFFYSAIDTAIGLEIDLEIDSAIDLAIDSAIDLAIDLTRRYCLRLPRH